MSTTRTQARRAAQEHAARLRAEQARQEATRRRRLTALAVVVVLALVAGAGVLVQSLRSGAVASDAQAAPTWAVDGTGIPVGDEAAPVTVEVFEDYMCPACAEFERVAGPALDRLVADGTARVVYRPMAFMDRYTSNRWSTRALNAAVCAVDEGGFESLHPALFAAQPQKGGAGPDDEALLALAADAGVDGEAFERCVRDETYAGWTVTATDAASKAGVTGTPTVRVDGEPLANWDPRTLTAAVEAAAGTDR